MDAAQEPEVDMIVVAGASGRTGGVVAETLLAAGKKVRALVRNPARGEPWRGRGAEVAVASLADQTALERALTGASALFTLLPEDPAVPEFHAYRRRMADATASAVARTGVPHVVFLSAVAAAFETESGPAADLHHAEKALRAAGGRVTVLRACYLQENVLSALPAARGQGMYPNFLPSADVVFPTIATRDIGRLAARYLAEPPDESETIDLLGPAYSVRQMAAALGAAFGVELRLVDIPASQHVDAFVGFGMPREMAEAVAEMFACFAAGRVVPKGDRSVRVTTTIEEVIRQALRGLR